MGEGVVKGNTVFLDFRHKNLVGKIVKITLYLRITLLCAKAASQKKGNQKKIRKDKKVLLIQTSGRGNICFHLYLLL
jgi:hypothetical protein